MVEGAVKCNNCGASERQVLFRQGVAQRHQIVRCMNCGLMYAYPRGTANLAQYVAAGQTGAPMTLQSPTVIRSFDKLPDYEPIGVELRALLPRGEALLEVGCHAGVLLDRFRSQGWKVGGVEPDSRAAGFARSHYHLDVKASALEDAGYDPATFDAVVMLHVIEHLDDPAGTVGAIARVLRPGGLLVVAQRRVGRTVSLGRLLWNIGVMSKSKTMQQMIERLTAALGLMHRGRLHLNTRDMVRILARKQAGAQ